MSGKGFVRRPENREAIERNWPFPEIKYRGPGRFDVTLGGKVIRTAGTYRGIPYTTTRVQDDMYGRADRR